MSCNMRYWYSAIFYYPKRKFLSWFSSNLFKDKYFLFCLVISFMGVVSSETPANEVKKVLRVYHFFFTIFFGSFLLSKRLRETAKKFFFLGTRPLRPYHPHPVPPLEVIFTRISNHLKHLVVKNNSIKTLDFLYIL